MSRALRYTCVLITLCIASSLEAALDADRIGIYHWGGQRITSMAEGFERITSLGGKVARVAFSPRYYSDYNMGAACYPAFSLTKLAHEPDIQRAFADPRIETLILTAYDGATFGDCHTHRYLNPRFYTPENVVRLRAEYIEFILHLHQRYGGTGRRFILSNWEGDNAIYCGAAYSYVTNEAFRNSCDLQYPTYYDGNSGPEQSLEGMRLWLRARQEAIGEGVERAAALGLASLEILHAPEISAVRMLEDRGLRSVLRDVLPAIRPDYVSWSAYESINREDPAAALAEDVAIIRRVAGVQGIIIGEAGYSRSHWGAAAAARLEAVIRRAFEIGVEWLICWNLHDQSPVEDYGVFDASDNLTAIGRLLRQEFGR